MWFSCSKRRVGDGSFRCDVCRCQWRREGFVPDGCPGPGSKIMVFAPVVMVAACIGMLSVLAGVF